MYGEWFNTNWIRSNSDQRNFLGLQKRGARIHSTATNSVIVLIVNSVLGCSYEDDEGFPQILRSFLSIQY